MSKSKFDPNAAFKNIVGASEETDPSVVADNEHETGDAFIKPREKEETRSKRVNLLLKPSVYGKAQKRCKKLGISLNECMNQFLDNWVNQ